MTRHGSVTITKVFMMIFILTFIVNSSQGEDQPKSNSTYLSRSDCDYLISKKVITESNPVPCSRLSKITFSHLNERGDIANDGVLIVLDILAPKVEEVMKKLLEQKFTIFKARPIEEYNGDDMASMADNNTSAFNGRAITGGSRWSLHAYGAAIDINPVQNPFIDIDEDGTARISPEKSARYAVNRLNQRPGKASRVGMAEEVVDIFAEHGFFTWGGYWNYPVDYQHFQVGPRSFIEALVRTPPEEGEELLNKYISMYLNCRKNRESEDNVEKLRAHCVDYVVSQMP
ncbi:M15 family metallopeptidase [Alteromonas sp. W12]|uniref:M15 family metallopeptidase n=1 Tax=Alteromonas sp. W12 TaxID=1772289 RepID=UPI0009FA068A|nr:M15 family metallopeptidase [Alteromonas sp. W12]